ncbi:MAG: RtcB family protein, partial [Candidatus Micrarchaeota archaeon]
MTEINRIRDGVFEIPKQGKMRVPARLYANDFIKGLLEESAFTQGMNVSYLPGIQKYSIMLPDTHYGYGFPIGGVAAFDMDEGVISPGGVGFDINCLCAGAKISTEFGGWMKIEDFEKEFSENMNEGAYTISLQAGKTQVKTLEKGITSKPAIAFMKKKSDKRILKIRTKTGLELQCSEDHPVLASDGMKKSSLLEKGEKVAVNYFEGIEIADDVDRKEALLAKIFGYLIGDGTLCRMGKKLRTCAFGRKEDLEEMQNDLKGLGFNSYVFERTRDHCVPTQYGTIKFNATCGELHIYPQEFSKMMIAMGMPLGKKASSNYRVPSWIIKASPLIKRLFLAGLFGAELTSPATSSKTGFYAPVFAQNKNTKNIESMRGFMIDIMQMLEELGIRCTKISERKEFKNKEG